MKRKLLIAALALLAIAGAVLLWQFQSGQRASYQGKSVRDWAAELYATHEARGTNDAAVAFREMGDAAIPALRSLIALRPPFYEKTFLNHARRIPARLRSYLFQKLRPGRTVEYRVGAIRAVGLLREDAAAALPEMLAALADSDSRVRWTAAQTIALLGPEAIAALIPLTQHPDVGIRHAAVYALGEARTNALPATLPLIQAATDTNDSVRASAYYSLARIGRPALPEAIALAVTNSDPVLRGAAFRSIIVLSPGGYYKSHLTISTNSPETRRLAILSLSRSRLTNDYAMNLFTNGLADEAPEVREAAELALRRIRTGKIR